MVLFYVLVAVTILVTLFTVVSRALSAIGLYGWYWRVIAVAVLIWMIWTSIHNPPF